MRAVQDRLILVYRFRVTGGDWEDVQEVVPIVRVDCRLGGTRPFFLCPGVVNGVPCGRRVAKLYGPDRYFLCRHCYRLAHGSQREDALDRARRRASKIRLQLGGDAGPSAPFPRKPKGMWSRTYRRLREKAIDAEISADQQFELQAMRLIARIESVKGDGGFWR